MSKPPHSFGKLYLIVLAIAVAASGGYYYRNQEKPEVFAGKMESVGVGLPADVALSLIIIAKEKGFFSQEGLDVEFKGYPSGKRSIEGMFAGEAGGR